MTYRPTTYRYRGKTNTYYVVYEKTARYRGGHRHERTYVKRFYVSGTNPKFNLRNMVRKTKQGTKKRGIEVVYETKVKGTMARRGGTRYRLPARKMRIRKIVPLPKGARNIRVTRRPPKGPLMAVD